MTRDDACGEAFDKVAKMLDLGYPGGVIISKKAQEGDPKSIDFPRPMLHQNNFDFSFAGLKTAVLLYLKNHPVKNEKDLANVCASFQAAVIETLVTKTILAIKQSHPKSVLLAGGVSANTLLRQELQSAIVGLHLDIKVHLAPLSYTTDNAVMIALAGYFRALHEDFVDPLTLTAHPNLRLI
jgi:N6-L-threonylcarbamoyladenine synthase